MCAYSAIKSFSSSFSFLKEDLTNRIINGKKFKDQLQKSDISAWKHRLEKAKVSKFSISQEYIASSEMVNSKSGFNEILVKKDRIDFTSEVVEKVYEFLPSEQKYILDEVGNVLELDPIGVVRTALEIMDYQLDPSWYAWGTKAPKVVDLKNINYRGTQYEDILTKCENADFELVTTENKWINLILHKGDKFPSQLKVEVRCKTEEAHVTDKMVALIGRHGCRYCNGRYKNQRITHSIAEALFGQKLEGEVKLVDKLKEVGVDSKYEEFRDLMDVFRMSLDTFVELNIKDKEGNIIGNIIKDKKGNIMTDRFGNEELHIAIESQGPQHYDNDAGFKSFLFLNKFEGKEGDSEWFRLKREWRRSLERDSLKRVAFKNNNKKGYYLIAVNNKLTATEKLNYILNQLYIQVGIDLYHLSKNVKINEIQSKTL